MKHYFWTFKEPERVGKYSTPDGMITGNGDIGLILGTNENALRICITKNDIWKASEVCNQPGGFRPLGWLEVNTGNRKSFYAEQRMDCGEIYCRTECENGTVEFTASAAMNENKILVSVSPADIALKLVKAEGEDATEETIDGTDIITRGFFGDELVFELGAAGAIKNLGGGKYVICTSTSMEQEDYKAYAVSSAKSVTAEKFDSLIAEDKVWWNEFYSKSSVSIPSEPEFETRWYAALYFMAVCARNEKFPPGIFGNFITVENPAWKNDYHLNYNFQAPFYALSTQNHTELMDCYDAPFYAFMKEGQRLAKEYFNCRGVIFPIGIGPLGMYSERPGPDQHFERAFLGQRTAASYAAVLPIMRWNAERDLDYARLAYPLLREIGDFWEDYLVFEDGRYVVKNDAIHEIPYYDSHFDPSKAPELIYTTNSLLALGFIRMMFTALIDISSALGVDADRHEKWEHILAHLSKYPTQIKDGVKVFRYVETGEPAWVDGNSLNIQHIYPAGQIDLSSDEELLKISRDTLLFNDRFLDDNATNSIFPCAARLGIDPKLIFFKLKQNIARFEQPNGLMLHGGGCLENVGLFALAIDEMLLQQNGDTVRLLPDWEMGTDIEFANLLICGGLLIGGKVADGKAVYFNVKPKNDRTVSLLLPTGFVPSGINDSDGKAVAYAITDGKLEFAAEGGKTYTIA